MKRQFLILSRTIGFILFYLLILVASIFLTMSLLIKGDELSAPDLIGKSLNEAYRIASLSGVYLKKTEVNYDKNFKPMTVINQAPVPGTTVKAKSVIKVFITSELIEVIVPDLTNYSLKDVEKILKENDLNKRFLSYIETDAVPVDLVISQSYPAGVRVPRGSGIDLLVCLGRREKSFIMPDVIEMRVEKVLILFENKGFKISKITEVEYPDLERGIIINQYPLPGHKIDLKSLISVEVSK
ncbi:MAG: PASTA domain-containing protein [Candidatus Aminicenantes bacterium]|nr:PASTA domain-containing protein [Candidatus Aminicenantes bacterium]